MKPRAARFLLLLAISLGACVQNPVSPPGTAATSRDLARDRIMVTLEMEPVAGIAALSPSGRLDYLPPTAREIRREQLEKARRIAEAHDLQLEEDWPIPELNVYCFVFRLDEASRPETTIARLSELPEVESVQPLQFFYGKGTAPQTRSRSVDQHDPLATWNKELNRNLVEAHRYATGDSVTIAVIDTGVDTRHEDLEGAGLTVVDLVDGGATVPSETHGTAVVGLLAARPHNGVGIRGYAPDARILLLRACWETGPAGEMAVCNSFTLAKALSAALESNATIVSLSVDGPRDPLLERLATRLVQDGRLLIAAGKDREGFPASVPNSIVAARQPAARQSAGPTLTLLPEDRYGLRDGTSMTTARVAGVATLMKELDPQLSASRFREQLETSVPDDPAANRLAEISRLLWVDAAGTAASLTPVSAPGND